MICAAERSAYRTARVLYDAAFSGIAPPPRLTVSQWADANRVLPRETTAEFGAWRTGRVPYTREIMDSLSSFDPCELVVLMKGAQIAGTEIGLNLIGYSIEHDPSPFLLVVPDFGFANKYSKRRIQPMVNACPSLKRLVSAPRAHDGGNTLLQKDYPGGSLIIASANSAAALSSDPVRRVMLDEVDRYPIDVEGEGSPLKLAEARTTTFWNRKLFVASTPKDKETSLIEAMFLGGDMRRFYVPCTQCGELDFITWTGMDPFKAADGEHFRIHWPEDRPEAASLLCPRCGGLTEEWQKSDLFAAGEWRPTSIGDGGRTKSYHLPGMYSPFGWLSWATMAQEHVKAVAEARRGAREPLKEWVNLRLGESSEEAGEKIEQRPLLDRAEAYAAPVPNGVGALTAAVDVQGDRLEAHVTGWGAGEESWAIDYRRFDGDPEGEQVWFDLDAYLLKRWRHESGRELTLSCTVIDSGGHHSEQVYSFCKARVDRHVYAVKGGPEMAKPLVGKPSYNNKYRTPLFLLCVDSGKDRLYSRLRIHTPGPGYYHFPREPWFDEEYVAQLVSEKKIPKIVRGRGSVPYWKKLRDRNEQLDLAVYNMAALYICGREFVESLGARAKQWAVAVEEGEAPESPRETPVAQAPTAAMHQAATGTSWLNSWRGR